MKCKTDICSKETSDKSRTGLCPSCRDKAYYKRNINKRKQYLIEHKEKIRAQKKIYKRTYDKVREQSPSFRLRKSCRGMIYKALKGEKNGKSMLKYLPYSMEDLKRHLENQFDASMSWDNYGSYWHIDHIYPQSLLPYSSMEEDNFQKCWALKNLRPMEAHANMSKGNKLIDEVGHDFS